MNSKLKKAFQILGLITTLLIVICLATYFFLVRPFQLRLDAAKPEILSAVLAFNHCLEANHSKECLEIYFTKNAQKLIRLDQFNLILNSIKTKIGKRHNASPIDSSWNMSSFTGTDDSYESITVQFQAIYDHDPFVVENYTFEKRDSKFLIKSFRVNSERLIQ